MAALRAPYRFDLEEKGDLHLFSSEKVILYRAVGKLGVTAGFPLRPDRGVTAAQSLLEGGKSEVPEPGLARPGSVNAGPQHQESAADIVVVPGNFHATVEAAPALPAVSAGFKSNDVLTIGNPHPHPRAVRVYRPRAFDAILVDNESIGIEPQTAIQMLVIEQQQARATFWRTFNIAFEVVTLVACGE
jgi:hypothetical protein